MKQETKQKLHSYLEQEFSAIALESNYQDIEHIVCAEDLQLLRKAAKELEWYSGLYNPVLSEIQARLSLFPPGVDSPGAVGVPMDSPGEPTV